MSSAYETAPATLLLATNCACCGRPLVDADSVTAGVGPECRKKHGFNVATGEPNWDEFALNMHAASDARPIANSTKLTAAEYGKTMSTREYCNLLTHHIAANPSDSRAPHYVAAIAALGYTKLAAKLADRAGSIKITVEGDMLLVQAGYSDKFVSVMRGVRGRRWDAAKKLNTVPVAFAADLTRALRSVYSPTTLIVGRNGSVKLLGASA